MISVPIIEAEVCVSREQLLSASEIGCEVFHLNGY